MTRTYPTDSPLPVTTAPAPYPLLLAQRLVERIWGGERLAAWLPPGSTCPPRTGECWLVYDENVIRDGACVGLSLAAVTRMWGADLVGTRSFARYGYDFPLLLKLLDATDRLSIQVHPDDDYAHRHEAHTGFHGKNEAWYVLAASPDAVVVSGLRQPTTRAAFAAAVAAGTVEELLHYQRVQAGDTLFIPAGTVHAIHAGLVLFEVQEKSDLTYRVYDYGRVDHATGQPRALHLAKALDVINYTAAPRQPTAPHPLTSDGTCHLLTQCAFFALERWTLTAARSAHTDPRSLEIVTVTQGTAVLHAGGTSRPLRAGDAVVLPAVLGAYTLEPTSTPCEVLRVYVPDEGDG